MTLLRWQMHVGFALESNGWGAAASTPAAYVPITKCDFEDDLKYYYDEAYRSVQAKDFGAYPTTATGKWNFTCDAYVDSMPVLLGAAMIGDNDTVSYVNGSVLNVSWTNTSVPAHTFILQPNGPKSLTLFNYNGYSEHAYQGARVEEVQIKYAPDGQLTCDYKGQSRLSVVMNGSFVPNIGTYAPVLGWQGLLTLNGTINRRLVESEFTFKRGSEVLFTQAQTQSPTNIYVFPLEVDGKITVDFQDETEYNLYRTGNQSASFDITFASSSNNAVRFYFPKPIYTAYKVDSGKDYLTAQLDFRAVYSQSDSTNALLTVYNAQSAAY